MSSDSQELLHRVKFQEEEIAYITKERNDYKRRMEKLAEKNITLIKTLDAFENNYSSVKSDKFTTKNHKKEEFKSSDKDFKPTTSLLEKIESHNNQILNQQSLRNSKRQTGQQFQNENNKSEKLNVNPERRILLLQQELSNYKYKLEM